MNNIEKHLLIKLNYKTNIKPKFLNNITFSNKIYCKNFFLFYLIWEFLFFYTNSKQKFKFSFVNLPKKKNSIVFLRAPNRAKKSQIHLSVARFKLFILIKLKINLINIKTLKITSLLKGLIHNFKFFESNILNLHSLEINLPYNYKNKV